MEDAAEAASGNVAKVAKTTSKASRERTTSKKKERANREPSEDIANDEDASLTEGSDSQASSAVDENRARGSSSTETQNSKKVVPLTQPGRPPRREYQDQTPVCRWNGCNKVFADAQRARDHEQEHGMVDQDVYHPFGFMCGIKKCGKIFNEVKILRKHLALHRPPSLACETCGKKFHEPAKLKRHESAHSGTKPFSCAQCGKEFNFKANLKTHERVHTGEKPFRCTFPGCDRRFAQASNRNAHVTTHHRKNETPKPSADMEGPVNLMDIRTLTASATASGSAQRPVPMAFFDSSSAKRPRFSSRASSSPGDQQQQSASAFRVPDSSNSLGFPSFRLSSQGAANSAHGFRSTSPFLLPPGMGYPTPSAFSALHSPAAPVSVPSSAMKTPSSISPIQGTPLVLPGSNGGPSSAPGSAMKPPMSADSHDKSVLLQLAQLSSEALDRSNSQSPPTVTGMTPTSFSAIPMLQSATPLCVIQPKTGNSSASSGSFSDQSVLFSSLNNSLGSVSSSSSQNWIHQLENDRVILTPHMGLRFTPDALK